MPAQHCARVHTPDSRCCGEPRRGKPFRAGTHQARKIVRALPTKRTLLTPPKLAEMPGRDGALGRAGQVQCASAGVRQWDGWSRKSGDRAALEDHACRTGQVQHPPCFCARPTRLWMEPAPSATACRARRDTVSAFCRDSSPGQARTSCRWIDRRTRWCCTRMDGSGACAGVP